MRISVSNAGYTTSRGHVTVLATHSIRQFPPHFPYACVTVCHHIPNAVYIHTTHTTESVCNVVGDPLRSAPYTVMLFLYILLTVHLGTILVNNQVDALFYVFIYFTSLHVSSNPVLIIRRINCITTSSGIYNSL